MPVRQREPLAADWHPSAGPQVVRHVCLIIWGMRCERCAERIEGRLRSLYGVIAASVDYGNRRAEVDYDAGVVGSESLIDAVWAAGATGPHRWYGATVWERGPEQVPC